jgi:hypothetical protein
MRRCVVGLLPDAKPGGSRLPAGGEMSIFGSQSTRAGQPHGDLERTVTTVVETTEATVPLTPCIARFDPPALAQGTPRARRTPGV